MPRICWNWMTARNVERRESQGHAVSGKGWLIDLTGPENSMCGEIYPDISRLWTSQHDRLGLEDQTCNPRAQEVEGGELLSLRLARWHKALIRCFCHQWGEIQVFPPTRLGPDLR